MNLLLDGARARDASTITKMICIINRHLVIVNYK